MVKQMYTIVKYNMKIDVVEKEEIIDAIKNMTAIQIDCVTKSRWKTRWRKFGIYMECAHCEFGFYERDILKGTFNFCPQCGAKMIN